MNDLERLAFYYGAGRLFIPRPRFLIYNPTHRCDLTCQHCGVWRGEKRKELAPEELGKLLKQSFFQKIEVVWLSGGEPSLRKDLKELAGVMTQALRNLKILGMASNGYARERILARTEEILKELDPEKQGFFLHLSLDGLGEVHNQIRARDDAFENLLKTVEGFNSLKARYPRYQLELGFNCVIQKANYFQLKEIYQFARKQKASITFNLVEITDQYYDNLEQKKKLELSEEEKRVVKEFLAEILGDFPAGYQSWLKSLIALLEARERSRKCLSLYSTLILDSDGTWIPCPLASEWYRVNFLEIEPEKFWKARIARALRKRIQRKLCPGCGLSCSLGDSLSLSEFLRGGFK